MRGFTAWPAVWKNIGVAAGDTVAVFDYDSNRFLEAFFAIPMMGAVMQMVDWRLSADQVRYTLEHAEARAILINSDFLPILEAIRDKLTHAQSVVVIAEQGGAPDTPEGYDILYEDLLSGAPERYDFPDLDEIPRPPHFTPPAPPAIPKTSTSPTVRRIWDNAGRYCFFFHRRFPVFIFKRAGCLDFYHGRRCFFPRPCLKTGSAS